MLTHLSGFLISESYREGAHVHLRSTRRETVGDVACLVVALRTQPTIAPAVTAGGFTRHGPADADRITINSSPEPSRFVAAATVPNSNWNPVQLVQVSFPDKQGQKLKPLVT